jgi:hypothetical protein
MYQNFVVEKGPLVTVVDLFNERTPSRQFAHRREVGGERHDDDTPCDVTQYLGC